MKYLVLLWCLISLVQSCDTFKKKSNYKPLVPPRTPFIVGVLEATADTIQHYPEVYVGYVSNPEGYKAKKVWATPGIWWPITNALVTRPLTRMNLKKTDDDDASVIIKGPLGRSNETKVLFTSEGMGIYGDENYQLPLEGGQRYELKVIMGDGQNYIATTRLPELFEWKVPRRTHIQLKLKQFTTGDYYEESVQSKAYPFTVDSSVGYIVMQNNSEYDHINYDTPAGGFIFEDRGNFLREGTHYGLFDAYDFPDKRSFEVLWVETDKNPLVMSEKWWLSLKQLNKPLSRFYYAVFPRFSGNSGGRWDRQDQARIQILREHNGSYLFDYMSNIKKIGKNGKTLPKEQTDAIGVFGGYSAAYRNLTVIPERSWDPDTLNWGHE